MSARKGLEESGTGSSKQHDPQDTTADGSVLRGRDDRGRIGGVES